MTAAAAGKSSTTNGTPAAAGQALTGTTKSATVHVDNPSPHSTEVSGASSSAVRAGVESGGVEIGGGESGERPRWYSRLVVSWQTKVHSRDVAPGVDAWMDEVARLVEVVETGTDVACVRAAQRRVNHLLELMARWEAANGAGITAAGTVVTRKNVCGCGWGSLGKSKGKNLGKGKGNGKGRGKAAGR